MQSLNSEKIYRKRRHRKSVDPEDDRPFSKPNKKKARALSSKVSGASPYIVTFMFVIFTFLIYDVILFNESVDFEALKSDLLQNVHNQSDAINAVIRSLNNVQKLEKSVHVNFVGSTGVGKTFTGNIVKKHFQPSVYESNMGKISDYEEILKRLKSACSKYNLVIIDDLTITDVSTLLDFIQKIPQDVLFLVISIFNIQETDDNLNYTINYTHKNIIKEKFNSMKVPFEMAIFHEFNKDQVGDWIHKQLVEKGVTAESRSELVQALLKEQNIKYHGLKGLSSKLNLKL